MSPLPLPRCVAWASHQVALHSNHARTLRISSWTIIYSSRHLMTPARIFIHSTFMPSLNSSSSWVFERVVRCTNQIHDGSNRPFDVFSPSFSGPRMSSFLNSFKRSFHVPSGSRFRRAKHVIDAIVQGEDFCIRAITSTWQLNMFELPQALNNLALFSNISQCIIGLGNAKAFLYITSTFHFGKGTNMGREAWWEEEWCVFNHFDPRKVILVELRACRKQRGNVGCVHKLGLPPVINLAFQYNSLLLEVGKLLACIAPLLSIRNFAPQLKPNPLSNQY